MDDHRAPGLGAEAIDGVEARIVRRKPLDVAVQLDAPQLQGTQGFLDDGLGIGLAGQHRPERPDLRVRGCKLGGIPVEGARHVRNMGVVEADDALDAPLQEEPDRLLGVEPVADGPGMGLEPAPEGLVDPRGKQVDVRVDDLEAGREAVALGVLECRQGEGAALPQALDEALTHPRARPPGPWRPPPWGGGVRSTGRGRSGCCRCRACASCGPPGRRGARNPDAG